MNLNRMHILIVDDDPSTLKVYEALLKREGHTVTTRERAFGTAPAILSTKPDVVLLDVNMPGLYGTEIVRVFKDRPVHSRPVFILFGGASQDELRALAEECGADAGISKSEDHRVFLVAFRTILVRNLRQAVSAP